MAGDHPLDVCLNGGRDYVQGWQMLAGAARCVRSDHHATSLETATFRRLTTRCVTWVTRDAVDDDTVIGAARFASPSGPVSGRFRELDAVAPRRDLVDRATLTATTAIEPLRTGVFRFVGVADFAALAATIVRAVKRVHAAPDVTDIWFTGQRGDPIPIADAAVPATGTMSVTIARLQARDGRFQSICPVEFAPDGQAMRRTVVTFAFRRAQASHVA